MFAPDLDTVGRLEPFLASGPIGWHRFALAVNPFSARKNVRSYRSQSFTSALLNDVSREIITWEHFCMSNAKIISMIAASANAERAEAHADVDAVLATIESSLTPIEQCIENLRLQLDRLETEVERLRYRR